MLLLNFSHPLTAAQIQQLETLCGQPLTQVISVAVHFDEQQPFEEQLNALMNGIAITSKQWQTEAILVVPPAYNFIAAAVLADLHGKMGYFPSIVRLRPVVGAVIRQFEIAEILDLQNLRNRARQERK